MSEVSNAELSSPDQSPNWTMVPVLQTLTVLSDGEEEQMEQKMGIENGFNLNLAKMALETQSLFASALAQHQANSGKRKVGRPITSVKTMNRSSFPAVDEIRTKLEAGECYVRPRASSSSSDVWALFQEVAYKDTHHFTGIVQCKTCHFLTRYHGQITGTSHMRRHHCFSILFPNSTPATRKAKNAQSNGSPLTNVDADSTTPRMLKKFKKEMSPSMAFKAADALSLMPSLLSESPLGNSSVSVHSAPPKKKLKNGNLSQHERSLISAPMGTSSSQSMLRTVNGYGSPSAGPSASPPSSNLSVPSSVSTNLRMQNYKQDLRDRLVQFCFRELVPLSSVHSESFRAILQSHLRLCTIQLHQQLVQQQPQHPQLMSLTSMVSSYMNHLSHQMPEQEQLNSYLDTLYRQCRDKIRHDLSLNLESNIGGALVCDSEHDACIVSAYYVDSEWHLVEAILSASASVSDLNQFVTHTLDNYYLQGRKKLSKFTFVSHGGLVNGASVCLNSMAHIVDKVVEESFDSVEEFAQGNELPLLSELLVSCSTIATRLELKVDPFSFQVDWIAKYELLKVVLEHRQQVEECGADEATVNLDLVAHLVDLLEPFCTASTELRQCSNHPTLCHVLLYYYKLKKGLSTRVCSLPQSKAQNLSVKKRDNDLAKSKIRLEDGSESDCSEKEDISSNKKESKMNNEDAHSEDEDSHLEQLIIRLKQSLMDNLKRYYEVQSWHRVATFLWPNFRLLKMLTPEEQKEVHEDVRKLIESRVVEESADGNARDGLRSVNENDGGENGIGVAGKSKSKSDFDEWEVLSDQDQDEVDKYLAVQLTSCSEQYVLQWWKEHSNEFPKLSQLAKWILSIPASVTTRERFRLAHNRQVEDRILFLHCNMQTDKFDLSSTRSKVLGKAKAKASKNTSVSSSSLIAQQ